MIINDLAKIIENFYLNLTSNGISFSTILIGLFIFNFFIYILCRAIKIAKYPSYSLY